MGSPCLSDSVERLNRWVAKEVVSEAVGEPVSQPKISEWAKEWDRKWVVGWANLNLPKHSFADSLCHFFEVLPHLLACPPAHLHADSLLNYLLNHPLCHLISHTFTMLLNSSCTGLRFFTHLLIRWPIRPPGHLIIQSCSGSITGAHVGLLNWSFII